MKAKIWISSSLLVTLFGFSAYNMHISEDKNQMIIKYLMKNLKDNHYEAIDINDNFSQEVYDLYLRRIDGGKRFLTQTDLEKMTTYKGKLDDELNELNYEFFDVTEEILNRRYQQTQEFYKEILAQPFDFTAAEMVDMKFEKMDFAKDKDDLKMRWTKLLKYQTMTRVADMIEEQKKAEEKKDTSYHAKTFVEMEAAARKKVLKSNDDYFSRIAKFKMEDRRALYLNTVTGVYDPHTGYYPPDDKDDFDISMSGKLEGIGAVLEEKEGYIKVKEINPGTASARQGELKAGDMILKVAQGAGEPVDIVDMPLSDAVKLIRGKKGTEVRLTVKKIDGTQRVIPIVRDIVIIDETFAKSLVLEDTKTKKKVGFIFLPRFYADFQDRNGRRCSEDVKKEIEKLKAEGIQGIILDLRNNGGGSLQDVVDMTGLFIDKGPVVQVKGRFGEPNVLADKNYFYPGTQYDGKLVVLINSYSASASEILAAAIQDYKRGVIIGSPSTFGKGTVQRFFNLDDYLAGQGDIKPLGQVKLTTQKFYRINGGATQLKGVVPDIIVPDNFAYIEVGEKEQEHYMPWDEIKPVTYDLWKNIPNYEQLRRNSKKRIDANTTFQMVNEHAKHLKEQEDRMSYPLSLEAYQLEQKGLKEKSDKLEKALDVEIAGMKTITPKADESYVASDTSRTRSHEDWKKNIRQDIYIYEAMQVINDMK